MPVETLVEVRVQCALQAVKQLVRLGGNLILFARSAGGDKTVVATFGKLGATGTG